MLSVEEALREVVVHAGRQAAAAVPLESCLGLVLAETVVSDIDSPPFTKALMDGFAVRSSDFSSGKATLRVIGEIAAGSKPSAVVEPGTAVRIMTGAPLPPGADAVSMLEMAKSSDGGVVSIEDSRIAPGQHIMPRSAELARGAPAVHAGTRLGPAELGILACVGAVRPTVYTRPTVAILSTGNELVPPEQTPSGSQIRNSNESLLVGLAQMDQVEIRRLGVAPDDAGKLEKAIQKGLEADVLLLTGGVSAGKFDLVPAVLERVGVRRVFHKVQFKPGKPLWFGERNGCLAFGLPGNPVSSMACYCLFVRTALNARKGMAAPMPVHIPARLSERIANASDRLTYHPAHLERAGASMTVRPTPWQGSADLKALVSANAFMVLPPNAGELCIGETVEALPFIPWT